MKLKFLITLVFFSTFAQAKTEKVTALICDGGGGHRSAFDTLKSILPQYDIQAASPLLDTFDTLKKLTGTSYEEYYNYWLTNSWIRFTNFMARRPGRFFFHYNRLSIEKKLYDFLKKEQPSLVISLIPYINYPASQAAKRLNIPFLNITLDADLTLWLFNMEKCTHPNYKITVPYLTDRIAKQCKKHHIPMNKVYEVGPVLRKTFFEPKDRTAILKTWNFPSNKPIVMLSRGSTGSTKLVDYAQALARVDYPLHLAVCIGRNAALEKKLKRIKFKPNVSMSIIPFTPQIADIMFVSDMIIAQPSPNICNEAMHYGLPVLIDKTSPNLFWEEATIDWINKHGTGVCFKRLSDLDKKVKEYIGKKKLPADVTGQPRFNCEIKQIIESLMPKKGSFSRPSAVPAGLAALHPPKHTLQGGFGRKRPAQTKKSLKIKSPNSNVVKPPKTSQRNP